MYEKFYRLEWLGKEGNPPTRDNSSTYKQALRYTILVIWLTKAISSAFYLWEKRECHLLTAVSAVICLLISTFSYIKIFLIVRHHQSQIHVQQQTVQNITSEGHFAHMARLKRSAINIFVFYIFLIICYSPM